MGAKPIEELKRMLTVLSAKTQDIQKLDANVATYSEAEFLNDLRQIIAGLYIPFQRNIYEL